ncbi:MAG: dihydrofolate reductase [Chloroflexi bacterium]|nr:dihydrofolate reductase [Chloroflexota bacterium]MYD48041.1 dihydrofolate reductase [Chloroflexota bacterium]
MCSTTTASGKGTGSAPAMPTIIYQVAMSLDGYIADVDGGVDWLPEGGADDYGYQEFYAGVVALVMGRRTYDQAISFDQWLFTGKPIYVFTSNPPEDNPHDVRFVQSDPADFVRDVASQYEGMVWLLGGANLAEQFRRDDLIDEYMLHVMPTILGRGVPLFGGDAPHTALELVATRAFDDGVVMLHYRRAGA